MASVNELLKQKKQQLSYIAGEGQQEQLRIGQQKKAALAEQIKKFDPEFDEKKYATAAYAEEYKPPVRQTVAQMGPGGVTTFVEKGPDLSEAQQKEYDRLVEELNRENQGYRWLVEGGWVEGERKRIQQEIDLLEQQAAEEARQGAKDVIRQQGDVASQMAREVEQRKSVLSDPAQVQALLARGVTVGEIERMRAAEVGRIGDMEAAQVAATPDARAAQIAAMQAARAAQIGAVGPAQAATIDPTQQAQFRQGQLDLIQQLQAQAAGTGPSLAEAQLRSATNRNLAQQLALAASARGGNVALQQRQLQQQTAAAGQDLASQAAMARIQEQQIAREQLAQALQAGRGADIQLATQQAQFQQEAGLLTSQQAQQRALAQAEMQQQAELANVAAVNNQRLEQAKLAQQAELVNVQKSLETALRNADFQQAARLQNQQKNIQVAIQNATLQQQANLANVESSRARVQQQAQIEAQLSLADQAAGMTAQQANLQAAMQMQELKLREDQFKQSRMDDYVKLGMTFRQAAEQTDLDWMKFQEQLNFQYAQMGQQATLSREQMALQQQMSEAQIAEAAAGRQQGLVQSLVAGGLTAAGAVAGSLAAGPGGGLAGAKAGAALGSAVGGSLKTKDTSDKLAKKDIKKASKDIADFLSALEAKKYKYKNPEKPMRGKGDFISVMAQDLEKTKMGKQMVEQDADGTKIVNYGKGFGAILAAQVELHNRIKQLESKLNKKK